MPAGAEPTAKDSPFAIASTDTARALLELAQDIEYLERDLAVAVGWGEALELKLELVDPPWWEKVWDHDLTKVIIFISGVELGRRFVVVK